MPDDAIGLELLYRGSEHGWKRSDFHDKCDEKGRTLTFFQSEPGYVAAGYTQISWGKDGKYEIDPTAFVCNLTDIIEIFRTDVCEPVVFRGSGWGPNF